MSQPGIPSVFHFVFGLGQTTRPFHLLHYLCLESCIQVNRPERVYFHYDSNPYGRYWDLIKNRLTLQWVYPACRDVLRLEILLEHGGVYADLDTLFVNPLPTHLYRKPFVMGRVNGRSSLGGALMASTPGAEFARRWLDQAGQTLDVAEQLRVERPEWIHVEPPRSFYKYPCTADGLAALLEECAPDYAGVYSIHLWHQHWGEWWRRDLTRFHTRQVTEEFIRTVDTTYNLAARRFLPPAKAVGTTTRRAKVKGEPGWPDRWIARAGLHMLAVRAAFRRHRKSTAERRRLRHFRRFWTGNSFERDNVVYNVVVLDEYGITGEPFRPGDVVIDVGAHIGVFSYLCHSLGSRAIHCYEPSERNFDVLRHNLEKSPGVHLHREAVWRGDCRELSDLVLSGPDGENTGAQSVMAAGRVVHFPTHKPLRESEDSARVRSVALDEILDAFDRVKLLKLDCEGSEFPILLTSRRLNKVEWIVGEIHEFSEEAMGLVAPGGRVEGHTSYRREHLVARLGSCGFRVRTRPGDPNMYWFEARRS